jgi:hypothetical protein
MNKKNGNGWALKLTIFLAGALIAVGGYIATVRSNTKRIEMVEVKTHIVETTVVGIQKDIEYIKVGIDEIKEEVRK